MKKHILLTTLVLALSINSAVSKDLFETPEDLENFHEKFYEAPLTPIPDVEIKEGSTQKELSVMPWVKKTRIKITNWFAEREYNKAQKLLEKEAPEEKSDSSEIKVKFADPLEYQEIKNEDAFEGGVKEHVTSNDVMLDADNIDYDEKTSEVIATGSPILKFPPQNITIKADKIVYNTVANIVKAYGSVEVIRDGNSVFGDYMQINMNEENISLDNITAKQGVMSLSAKKGEMSDDKITLYSGIFESTGSRKLDLHSRLIGGNRFYTMDIDEEDRSSINEEIGDVEVKLKVKEAYINAGKNTDTIKLKKAQINYGGKTLFTMPSVTMHTNKHHQYFEGNYPEFGSRGRLGMFAGPGFAFDTPLQNGSTVKLIPIINNKSGMGVGGLLKYRSGTNRTEFGYGSAADIFVLRGRQYLDDHLYMQYGMNSYMDEWFMGPRMSKYNAELIYHDRGVAHSTIGKDLDLRFRHRLGFGYMQNTEFNRHDENIPTNNMGTTRTRYMAEVSQSLFNYEGKKDLKHLNLSLIMQGSAALYGTGDTQFIGRMGPCVHSQYKYWMQDVGFFAAAYQDGTPMRTYDMYRYGHANVFLRESLRVNKYLTLAWSGTMTLTDDSPNDKLFQENSFIIAFGPDDFKLNVGYDWVRRQTYFSFVIAMDTKGSSIEFDKMEIKNPDKLAKNNEPEVELKVFGAEDVNTPKKMMYAEVIDIEDPSREEI